MEFKNEGFKKIPFQLFLFCYLVMSILLFGCLSFLFLELGSYGSGLYICKWLSSSIFLLPQFDFVLETIAKLYVAITSFSLLLLWHLLHEQMLVLTHLNFNLRCIIVRCRTCQKSNSNVMNNLEQKIEYDVDNFLKHKVQLKTMKKQVT